MNNLTGGDRSFDRMGKVQIACDCGCGTIIERYRCKIKEHNFAGHAHAGRYKQAKYLEKMCGVYLPIVQEYLDGAARSHYRDLKTVRSRICPFLLYVSEQQSLTLESVTSISITLFQVWARRNRFKAAANDISLLSTFFAWLMLEEHHGGPNPVIPKIHGKKDKPRKGKPYKVQEMRTIRRLLADRGNERLRAVFELVSASGLRISEVERLKLTDLDLLLRELHVGLPNKTERERTGYLNDVAKTAIAQWLAVRREDCGHSYLFHNYLGSPLKADSIRGEFKRALCKQYKNKPIHHVGLDSFSVHRIRHTLASELANVSAEGTVLMSVLGWVTQSSMEQYILLDRDSKMSSYQMAMRKREEAPEVREHRVVISPADLMLRLANA